MVPWLPDQLRPILRPAREWTEDARYAALQALVAQEGFRIEVFEEERFYGGQAVPWRIIKLREIPLQSLRDRLPRFLHEVVHMLRMQAAFPRLGRFSRWGWGICYLLNPWYRRREELIGEGYEAALRSLLAGSDVTVDAVRHHVSTRLGGWFRFPYFAGGSVRGLEWLVAEYAVKLRRAVAAEFLRRR